MIYFCADDYGLNPGVTEGIRTCMEKGALSQVSVLPNFDLVDLVDLDKLFGNKDIRVSLHLNLVEGKCMANAKNLHLIADQNGNFKHTFGGLFRLGLFHAKQLEKQLYEEIRAQVLFWKSILPEHTPFLIDSHQHTHLIPVVFRTLIRVLQDEKINVKHMRIPAEPFLPYLKTPSLYFTYSPINLIKQWVLKFLWQINKPLAQTFPIPTSLFFGILFSGKMDVKRVAKVLSKYETLAKKDGRDVEVLFHPGYTDSKENGLQDNNIVFYGFYSSPNRKTELDSVIKLSEGSVL